MSKKSTSKQRLNPKEFAKLLGQSIRRVRNSKGWSLEECERRGWGNWRHLQKIESGAPITMTTLLSIAQFFGVDPHDLLRDI